MDAKAKIQIQIYKGVSTIVALTERTGLAEKVVSQAVGRLKMTGMVTEFQSGVFYASKDGANWAKRLLAGETGNAGR